MYNPCIFQGCNRKSLNHARTGITFQCFQVSKCEHQTEEQWKKIWNSSTIFIEVCQVPHCKCGGTSKPMSIPLKNNNSSSWNINIGEKQRSRLFLHLWWCLCHLEAVPKVETQNYSISLSPDFLLSPLNVVDKLCTFYPSNINHLCGQVGHKLGHSYAGRRFDTLQLSRQLGVSMGLPGPRM